MCYNFLYVQQDVKIIGKHQDRQFTERKTQMVTTLANLRFKCIKWKSLVHSLNPPNQVMNLGSLPYVFLSLILLFCSCFTNKLLSNFILRRKVIAPKFINRFYGESFCKVLKIFYALPPKVIPQMYLFSRLFFLQKISLDAMSHCFKL